MRNRISCILRNCVVFSNWLEFNIKIFLVFFPLYLINRLIKAYIEFPVLGYLCQCHLNDYIGGIIFCAYLNITIILGHRKPILSLIPLCSIMLGVSLLWEYFFPLILPYSTSDPWDVAAYMLGTLTYYIVARRSRAYNP